MDLLDAAQMGYLKKAFDGLESGLTRFLEESKLDWIICGFSPFWLPPVTASLGISQAFFFIINAWFLAFIGPLDVMLNGSDYRTEPEDFMEPPKWFGFESQLVCRRFEAKWCAGAVHDAGSWYSDPYRFGQVISGSDAIVMRHCYEFEPHAWLGLLEELHHRHEILLGLLPPALEDHGNEVDDQSCVTIEDWLDHQRKDSIIYVALGSEVMPTQDQLNELAHGLELSGIPFFWVLRKVSGSDSMELPEGFEERVRGRGIVWRRWALQLKILSHDSVGGFLTHCGWGFIVEGLMFGLPLVTLPFIVDQGLNSRVVVERQLGVEVARNDEEEIQR